MDNQQKLFLMHIMDGYSFRNVMGIIKSEIEEATMVISPLSVEISFLNTSKCAVHKIMLDPKEFAAYTYNILDENGNIVPEYPVGFKTSDMFNTTKGIGRRDGIRIYWLIGDNKINVQPIKTSAKDPGRASANFVKILTIEHMRYDVGSYDIEPNVRVQAKDFADLCSQAGTSKCANLEINGFPHAVIFKGILPNGGESFISQFVSQIQVNKDMEREVSNMDEIDNLLKGLGITDNNSESRVMLNVVKGEDRMKIKIPIATTKALSKIHNVSATGTMLKFYFAEGKPTKLESQIGTYGTYTICLRSIK